jgi:hypothetical protein
MLFSNCQSSSRLEYFISQICFIKRLWICGGEIRFYITHFARPSKFRFDQEVPDLDVRQMPNLYTGLFGEFVWSRRHCRGKWKTFKQTVVSKVKHLNIQMYNCCDDVYIQEWCISISVWHYQRAYFKGSLLAEILQTLNLYCFPGIVFSEYLLQHKYLFASSNVLHVMDFYIYIYTKVWGHLGMSYFLKKSTFLSIKITSNWSEKQCRHF